METPHKQSVSSETREKEGTWQLKKKVERRRKSREYPEKETAPRLRRTEGGWVLEEKSSDRQRPRQRGGVIRGRET